MAIHKTETEKVALSKQERDFLLHKCEGHLGSGPLAEKLDEMFEGQKQDIAREDLNRVEALQNENTILRNERDYWRGERSALGSTLNQRTMELQQAQAAEQSAVKQMRKVSEELGEAQAALTFSNRYTAHLEACLAGLPKLHGEERERSASQIELLKILKEMKDGYVDARYTGADIMLTSDQVGKVVELYLKVPLATWERIGQLFPGSDYIGPPDPPKHVHKWIADHCHYLGENDLTKMQIQYGCYSDVRCNERRTKDWDLSLEED